MNTTLIILIVLFVVGWIGFMIFIFQSTSTKSLEQKINVEHVNQNSFQKYAKFYGEYYPADEQFDQKLNKIYILIMDHHMDDINKIAELSFCTIPECVIKIRYLKNKRLLGDLFIDTIHMKLLPCSEEDQKLLEKYSPFIYGSHSQVFEMSNVLPNEKRLTIQEFRKELFQEIKSLYDKGLLNGIKLNEIDQEIIYYTIEKRKFEPNIESVRCPNCGALNDVDSSSKTRCGYCQTILKGAKLGEEYEK